MYSETSNDFDFSRSYLTVGEAVLWKGQPGKGHLLTAQDIFMIPFSIFWCGFAIFWTATAFSTGVPIFWLFGISFVCVGLYITVGRFIWTAYIRRRTFYVITNKKILRKRGSRVDLLDLKTLPPMRTKAFTDGSGTITFGQPVYYRRGYGDAGAEALFSLEVIPEVARVHALISDTER